MIIDSRLIARMEVSRVRYEAEAERLQQAAVDELVNAAQRMGADTSVLQVEVLTGPHPENSDAVYLYARFTGGDHAEVIGGAHDGTRKAIAEGTETLRIPLDRGPHPPTMTDENSRWYKKSGVSDVTGFWAFTPTDAPPPNQD